MRFIFTLFVYFNPQARAQTGVTHRRAPLIFKLPLMTPVSGGSAVVHQAMG